MARATGRPGRTEGERMVAESAAVTAYTDANATKTAPGPRAARSRPATAGPTTVPTPLTVLHAAVAGMSWDGWRTSCGRSA